MNLKKGDYILASKYADGHLGDHWFVGWFDGMSEHMPPRYMVVDNDGEPARANGFRRAERITPYVGKTLIDRASKENWERHNPIGSVWDMRDAISLDDQDPLAMVRMVDGVWHNVETLPYDAKTTKLKMRSGIGQIQAKLIADEEIEAIVLTKRHLVEISFDEFVSKCREMAASK